MSQSLSRIYVHAVFSTKHRVAVLSDGVRPHLSAYTATVLSNLDCVPIEIGGVADHIHLHILPRWIGDTNFLTTVAETRILAETIDVTWERLSRAFSNQPS